MSGTTKAFTPKGEARRDALIAAVLRLFGTDGAAAVTHRAVAREAGVPLAAATYYFASIDDLLLTALRTATEQQVEMFRPLAGSGIREFAEQLVDWIYNHRAVALAQYELMFLAMRRPALREDAELWYAALGNALQQTDLDEVTKRKAALAIDGLCLQMLWKQSPRSVDDTEEALREILI